MPMIWCGVIGVSDNGTKPRLHLQPYTDAQMLHEALWMYAGHRRAFAEAIAQEDYLNSDGEPPTKKELKFAVKAADQAERLVEYAAEKAESPIIMLQ